MEIDHRIEGDVCIIVIREIITNESAVETRRRIISLVEQYQPQRIVLSLEAEDISSLGLGCIIAIYQDLTDKALPLMMSLSPPLQQKFIRAKLDRVLDIFSSLEAALQSVSS